MQTAVHMFKEGKGKQVDSILSTAQQKVMQEDIRTDLVFEL